MFFPLNKVTALLTLILGSFITISSSSWLGVWLGMEVNLMGFIPLLLSSLSTKSMETGIKYFLVQAFASTFLIFYIMMAPMAICNMNNLPSGMILTMLMGIKMGAAPFHFWFPQIMEYLDWTNALILMTWQKLSPFLVISYSSSKFMLILMAMSAIVGAFGGINQISMKMIMAYSSILHMGWILGLIFSNHMFWWFYYVIYSIIAVSVITPMITHSVVSVNNLVFLNNMGPMKNLYLMNFLSLAGVPPFLGFFLKLTAVILFIKSGLVPFFFVMILLMASFAALYFYMRLSYTSFLTLGSNPLPLGNPMINKMNLIYLTSMIISLVSIPLAPMILSFA
uniref:NADH-ubiquinone oxidoreductase chain 2 n=1 Tax=Podura aquatica TaxID=50589 RepID=Q6DVG7_9HEXA|nr:NADH dehydrogenase subunit 2 [Podura aquatica]AAT69332.1 NADH dehydrogenase subunit 2 [Podura aquatica]